MKTITYFSVFPLFVTVLVVHRASVRFHNRISVALTAYKTFRI